MSFIKTGGSSSQFLKANGTVDANAYKTTDADTKNTTGASNKTATKLFLTGAASQTDGIQTFSNSNCYIGTDNCLYSSGAKVLTSYTDTKNTAGSVASANKLYLVGAESQTTSATTYSNNQVYTQNGQLYSLGATISGNLSVTGSVTTGSVKSSGIVNGLLDFAYAHSGSITVANDRPGCVYFLGGTNAACSIYLDISTAPRGFWFIIRNMSSSSKQTLYCKASAGSTSLRVGHTKSATSYTITTSNTSVFTLDSMNDAAMVFVEKGSTLANSSSSVVLAIFKFPRDW